MCVLVDAEPLRKEREQQVPRTHVHVRNRSSISLQRVARELTRERKLNRLGLLQARRTRGVARGELRLHERAVRGHDGSEDIT